MVMLRSSITNANSIPSEVLVEADKSRRHSWFIEVGKQENVIVFPRIDRAPLEVEGTFTVWADGYVDLFVSGMASGTIVAKEMDTEPEFHVEQEISASPEEYEDILKGDFSKLGLSPEVIEQARDLFAKYVSVKLSEEGIEADHSIQEKIVNILTLVAYKNGEISLVVQ